MYYACIFKQTAIFRDLVEHGKLQMKCIFTANLLFQCHTIKTAFHKAMREL